MRYYPVNLDIRNRNCLVVGGGTVATRKVLTLIKCGAIVTVVSPVVGNELGKLALNDAICLKERNYRSTDMDHMFLVIGATDDRDLNRQIFKDAEARETLCNIADQPDVCNFILPSVIHQGDLIIAISTSGKSPAYAKKLRKDLEKTFGKEHAVFLKLMGAIREKLLAAEHAPEAHKQTFEDLIQKGLIDLIKHQKIDAINRLLEDTLGPGYEYSSLMNHETSYRLK